jgi:glutamate-1-semialdehyde 2,1-aminomutase
MRAVGREPLFIESARDAELVDVDGNHFIDYVCSWGPLIAGHAHPEVVAAITAAAVRGTSYGAPTEPELLLAEEIVARVPSAEMVRFTSSGTEAAMTVIRLARAVTGRDRVLKFAGAYHGHVDGLLAEAGSGLATQGIPASPGVTSAQAQHTVIVPWNDGEAVERAFDQVGGELAAVLAEPLPANMGVVPAEPGFLDLLRERSSGCGALLVFDEVISGFRVARGGAQERFGVQADLTILGKVVGGGLPLAALAGPSDLLGRLAPAGDIYQAGTLSGNPLAAAAGLATLRFLTHAAYTTLEATTERLARGLEEAAARAHIAVVVKRAPGLLTTFLTERDVRSYEDAAGADAGAYAAFFRAMLERGVYLPPSPFEAWFPSLAHREAEVERTLEAAVGAFGELAGGR